MGDDTAFMQDKRSSRVCFDTVASDQRLAQHPSPALHDYPFFWICMQLWNQATGAVPQGLVQAARCYPVTLLLLKMGPDD